MTKSKSSLLVFALLLLQCFVNNNCSVEQKICSVKDFDNWIAKNAEKIRINKKINGVSITVQYIQPEYNALKEMESMNYTHQSQYDSLLAYYHTSASFIMTLAPDGKMSDGDIMYKNVKNFKEYIIRAMEMNFNLENQVTLETKGIKYVPALSSLDNTYSLTNDRKINFVFVPESKEGEIENATDFDFVYHDDIFQVGTLHFYFDKKKIEIDLPEIEIQ